MVLWIWDHLGAPLKPLQDHGHTTLFLMLDLPPLEIHSFAEAGPSSEVSSLDADTSAADGNSSQTGGIVPSQEESCNLGDDETEKKP